MFTPVTGIYGHPSPILSELLSAIRSGSPVAGPFAQPPVLQGYIGNLVGTTGHLYRPGGDPVHNPSDSYGLLQSIGNLQWDPTHQQYTFTACYVSTLPGSIAGFSNPIMVTGTLSGGNFAPFHVHFSGTITDASGNTEAVDYQGTITWNGAHFRTTGTLSDVVSNVPPAMQGPTPTEGIFA
jgi:hypothetical protein